MENIDLTVYTYIVLGLLGVVVLLTCWVVYLQLCMSQVRKTLFSISDSFTDFDSVANAVRGFGQRWDYITKAITELQAASENKPSYDQGGSADLSDIYAHIDEIERKLEDLQMMDPESKMYTRAVKMVKNGSSIEEVMEECELPRSEAQLLFSIHKH